MYVWLTTVRRLLGVLRILFKQLLRITDISLLFGNARYLPLVDRPVTPQYWRYNGVDLIHALGNTSKSWLCELPRLAIPPVGYILHQKIFRIFFKKKNLRVPTPTTPYYYFTLDDCSQLHRSARYRTSGEN